MRRIDPTTGYACTRKVRRRYNIANQARELTFSCYRGIPLLNRDRTRNWFV